MDYIVSEFAKVSQGSPSPAKENGGGHSPAHATFDIEDDFEVLDDPEDDFSNPLAMSSPKSDVGTSKATAVQGADDGRHDAAFVQRLIADVKQTKLLSDALTDCVLQSLRELTSYNDDHLAAQSFELLFDVVMTDKELLELMCQCQIITDATETRRYLEIEDMFSTLEGYMQRLGLASVADAEREQTLCSSVVDNILMISLDDVIVSNAWHTQCLQLNVCGKLHTPPS